MTFSQFSHLASSSSSSSSSSTSSRCSPSSSSSSSSSFSRTLALAAGAAAGSLIASWAAYQVVVRSSSWWWWWYRRSQRIDYSGMVILVTGSDSGIGHHAALTLVKEGFTVVAGVLTVQSGQALLETAQRLGLLDEDDNDQEDDPSTTTTATRTQTRLIPMVLDVTKPDQIQQAVQQIQDLVGDRGLYGLFNNAGIINPTQPGQGRSVEHVPLDNVRQVLEVNLLGVWQMTQAFLPLLRQYGRAHTTKNGHDGLARIVTTSSVAGKLAGAWNAPYSCSKFAVEALMDCLRREVAGLQEDEQVHVSLLEPGIIQTPIYAKALLLSSSSSSTTSQTTPTRQDENSSDNYDNDGRGVYAALESSVAGQVGQAALQFGTSPQCTSHAVVQAMQSPRPHTRYMVGGLVGLTRVLLWLPDAWTDALLLAGQRHFYHQQQRRRQEDGQSFSLTEQELQQIQSWSQPQLAL